MGRMGGNHDGDSDSPYKFGDGDSQATATKVIEILNRMDQTVIYKLYYKIAHETRDKLEAAKMLPEVCPTDAKGRQNESGYAGHGNQVGANKNEHPALK